MTLYHNEPFVRARNQGFPHKLDLPLKILPNQDCILLYESFDEGIYQSRLQIWDRAHLCHLLLSLDDLQIAWGLHDEHDDLLV